jgi:non-specific serine/threonine protein kinase
MTRRADEILDAILELPPAERRASLERECGGDVALEREVGSLLDSFEAASEFLEPPTRVPRATPRKLGRYLVREEIGRGGTGVVYLAEDSTLGRLIAIKVLTLPILERLLAERVRDEARALASITQPNVATVYSVEEAELGDGDAVRRELFLTMEHVAGPTLRETLRSDAWSIEQALDAGRQIAAGLEAAHARGIVHRDLKPANVRRTHDGWWKLLDFGLAAGVPRLGQRGERPDVDVSARIEGTPGYMSPEQLEGHAAAAASDLWSLGCVLFECLTSAPAIGGATLDETLSNTRDAVVRWHLLPEATPARVRTLLEACLRVEPADRPASATESRRVLEEELLLLRAARFITSPASPNAADTPPKGNLPVTWSSLVGREVLLTALERLAPSHPLVTLTGPGGVGKTRAAVELGARVRPRHAEGVWFIDLTQLSDGSEIAALVARTMSLHEVRARGKEETLIENVTAALERSDARLILDNCEHVAEDAAHLCLELLRRCERLRIIATSRAPLGVPGEQVIPVVPLELPEPRDSVEVSAGRDAVRLFETRARLRDPAFTLDGDRLGMVIEMCRALDGLPLAIELAAGQVRTQPLREIHRRVLHGTLPSDRTNLRAERHRTLEALVEWSHNLLTPPEQALLARLSVFRGGWTLEAAEQVCAGDDLGPWQVCEALSKLVDQSLVVMESLADGSAGRARYRFLETVSAFASARLGEDLRARTVTEERYVRYFARHAAEASASHDWIKPIEQEYVNIAHALECATLSRRLDLAFGVCAPLSFYWRRVGLWSEGLLRMRRLLAAWRGRAAGGPHEPDLGNVTQVLSRASFLAANLNHTDESRTLDRDAVEVARLSGDRRELARTLQRVGGAAFYRLELDTAEPLWTEAADLYRMLGESRGLADCLGNLGAVHYTRRDLEVAGRYLREQRELSIRLEDWIGVSKAELNLGRIAFDQGRFEEARDAYEKSLARLRNGSDRLVLAIALQTAADAHRELGDLQTARRYLEESRRSRDHLGVELGNDEHDLSWAQLEAREGDVEGAKRRIERILEAYDGGLLHAPDSRHKAEVLLQKLRS